MIKKSFLILTPSLLAIWLQACNENEGFKSTVQTKSAVKANDAQPDGNSTPNVLKQIPPITRAPDDAIETAVEAAGGESFAEPAAEVQLNVARSLEVILPFSELRSGKKTMQAKAVIKGEGSNAISWKIVGPSGVDLGTIDSTGLYTSPADETILAQIQIVATLVDDVAITSKKNLSLVPVQQLFVGCKVGNSIFPIAGDIYSIAEGTGKMPDFSKIEANKKETICLDEYNIPVQSWVSGFPASPGMVEWFALHSTAYLNIPAEGDYEFKLSADDGANLYIDDKIAVNNDGTHSFTSKTAKVHLTAGKHKIVTDWYQGPRDELGLTLAWKVPGAASFVIIPTASFSSTISAEE